MRIQTTLYQLRDPRCVLISTLRNRRALTSHAHGIRRMGANVNAGKLTSITRVRYSNWKIIQGAESESRYFPVKMQNTRLGSQHTDVE
jgi:hypothetical protein